jgi:hypothetical protein
VENTQTEQTTYSPTPHLPDEQGKATLSNLWNLYFNIEADPTTKKKVRSGSHAERHAIAEMQAALIKAAVPFESHVTHQQES